MWVRIPRRAMNAAERACGPELAEVFHRERIETTQWLSVRAPYTAWFRARDRALSVSFNSRGQTTKAGRSAFLAVKHISRALGSFDRHAALRGAGVIGHVIPITFPLWRLDEPDEQGRLYTPIPYGDDDEHRFVVLVPDYVRDRRRNAITVWRPAREVLGVDLSPDTDRLAEPLAHRECLRL